MNTISIKNLRENLPSVANAAEKGESFIVYRRSKPCFRIEPIFDEVDPEEDEKGWTTIVDFTDGGKRRGEPIQNVIKALKDSIKGDYVKNKKTSKKSSAKL